MQVVVNFLSKYLKSKLQIASNKCVRFCLGLPPRGHINPSYFKKTNRLRVERKAKLELPLDETLLDVMTRLIEQRGFRPSASKSRACQSNVATSDKDKQICFVLMSRTSFTSFRLEYPPYL